MRKLLLITAALGVMALSIPAHAISTRDPGVNTRQRHQHQRIRQGWRKGQLTRREAKRLVRGERRIRRMERRGKRDGHLTLRERRRLHRALNRQNHQIHRLRHNRQTR